MKKSAWYVVLLLVVLIAAVAVCVSTLRSDGEETPAGTPTPPPVSAAPAETPALPPEETPGNTPEPQETPVPTEPPVFETKEPIVPTPAPTEKPAATASGSFSSNTGTGLNMKVVWETFSAADGSIKLKVDVFATHYSFNTSALYNAVTVTVGGQAYSMNSAEVSYDGDELSESLIASCTVDAPSGGVNIEVVWDYKGSYSGTELETIEASGYAYLG